MRIFVLHCVYRVHSLRSVACFERDDIFEENIFFCILDHIFDFGFPFFCFV